ncbi:hypothetical protein AB9F41_34085, partial [Rhizobium leguminosarum]|uniref:hypothetical protein n=1 Tax=Rhizobium leguminosarum TaxID=384 RepID=UPI003F9D1EF9
KLVESHGQKQHDTARDILPETGHVHEGQAFVQSSKDQHRNQRTPDASPPAKEARASENDSGDDRQQMLTCCISGAAAGIILAAMLGAAAPNAA